MKNITTLFALFFANAVSAQLLLETKDGDELFKPLITTQSLVNTAKQSGMIKLNLSDQTIGFDYYKGPNSGNFVKYKFWNFGVKAKPTEGYAAVFNSGQFSPGVTFSGAITQVKLLDRTATKPENYFFDWGSFYFSYAVNKYQLYKPDTIFKNQLYSETLKGFSFGGIYNMLLSSRVLISIKLGYSRRSNYNDLDAVEIKDSKTILDTSTNTTRQSTITKSARQGKYAEFDAFPISLSFTKLTYDDPTLDKAFTFGYSIYINALPTNNSKSITNAGLILYLAEMKKGISTPVIGLNFQFSDFFDIKKINNGLLKRLGVGLTTNIPIL